MSVLFITGTDTGIGKTMVTAAIASVSPQNTAVVKLAQTGVGPGEPGDIEEIGLLSGCPSLHELVRYPDPLSPHHAARISGRPTLAYDDALEKIEELRARHDLVLVEGSGGVMVPFGQAHPWNIRELADDVGAPLLLVTRAGLGTLNHTMLAIEYLDDSLLGVVIGCWPDQPDLAARCNVTDLGELSRSGVLGVLPERIATRGGFADGTGFPAQAQAALGPQLGGTFDWVAFEQAQRPAQWEV